ncbi:MAG: ketoacyl-ACP synthase III [candidate division NC10 bacterium]|nr:ketoacyl-ACP synthase III [candidate division NC10 bacterium]
MAPAAGIVGTGSYLPEHVMTNHDLARTVETSDEWIQGRIGIRERRIVAKDEATSDLGARAARRALESAGVAAGEVDLLILATSSPDSIQPPTACHVQREIGAWRAAVVDVNAVCTGFVYGLSMASDMMRGNPAYRTALVVGAEAYSRILNWEDRTTCVIFGDGAGAAVLRPVDETICVPGGGSRLPASPEVLAKRLDKFHMNGREVWDFVMEAFPQAVREAVRGAGLSLADVDLVISHQANGVLIRACMDRLGLPMDRTYLTVDRYGNTSAASVPITLDEASRAGRLRRGDVVVLVAFGGGLTWGATVMRWAGTPADGIGLEAAAQPALSAGRT